MHDRVCEIKSLKVCGAGLVGRLFGYLVIIDLGNGEIVKGAK